jgi:hypothetical protein
MGTTLRGFRLALFGASPAALPFGLAALAGMASCASTPSSEPQRESASDGGAMGAAAEASTSDDADVEASMSSSRADAAGPVSDASPSGADAATESTSNDAAAGGDTATAAGPCTGVPIVPDENGSVSAGSNSVGIHGSWFVYSDCTDLQGHNCAMVSSPTGTSFANVGGKMCTSGQTSMAAGAWGAGIALELNDGPPQQPYDTTAHGVNGFCFNLSGPTIPSTTVRVAFPTQDNNDNAYLEAVSTPGLHNILFSDIAQGSWVTSKSPWEPTKVMLIQFQIPSSTTAPVSWNFCVDSLTAIVN